MRNWIQRFLSTFLSLLLLVATPAGAISDGLIFGDSLPTWRPRTSPGELIMPDASPSPTPTLSELTTGSPLLFGTETASPSPSASASASPTPSPEPTLIPSVIDEAAYDALLSSILMDVADGTPSEIAPAAKRSETVQDALSFIDLSDDGAPDRMRAEDVMDWDALLSSEDILVHNDTAPPQEGVQTDAPIELETAPPAEADPIAPNNDLLQEILEAGVMTAEEGEAPSADALLSALLPQMQNAPVAGLAAAESESAAGANGYIVDLSWTAFDGATGYRVLRDGTELATGLDATAYQDTTPARGTTHTYTVTALDDAGEIAGSSATATATIPMAPVTGIAASASGNAYTLTWTAVEGAEGYRVTRSGESEAQTVATPSYTDDTARFSTDYTYSIVAYNAAGSTAATEVTLSAALSGGLMAPPAIAPQGDAGVKAEWNADSRAIVVSWPTYAQMDRIDGIRASFTGSDGQTHAKTATSASDPGTSVAFALDGVAIVPGTPYTFTIETVANGATANAITVQSAAIALGETPTLGSPAVLSPTSVKVTWVYSATPPDAMEIRYRTGGGAWTTGPAIDVAGAQEVTLTGLSALTAYEIALFADMGAGLTESDTLSVTTAPETPTGGNVDASTPGQLTVSWSYPDASKAGQVKYRVERVSETGSDAHAQTFADQASPLVDTGVLPLYQATYRIYARAADGVSENETPLVLDGTAELAAPASVSAVKSGEDVVLSWAGPGVGTVYLIEYALANEGAEWTRLDAIDSATYTLQNGGPLVSGNQYLFRVFSGLKGDGEAARYSTLSTTSSPFDYAATPAAATNLRITMDGAGYKVLWDAVEGATYRVTRQGGAGDPVTETVEAAQYIDDTAAFMQDYTYSVVVLLHGLESASASMSISDAISQGFLSSMAQPPAVAPQGDPSVTAAWNAEDGEITVAWPAYADMSRVDGIRVSFEGSDGATHSETVTASSPNQTSVSFALDDTRIKPGVAYTFEIAPLVGETVYNAITVNNRPIAMGDAPTFVSATPLSDTQVELAWENGDRAPSFLRIQWREQGEASWPASQYVTIATPASTTSTTINLGLSAMTNYEFALFADMGSGETPETPDSTILAMTTPKAPIAYTVDESEPGQLTVSWRYPDEDDASRVKYRVVRTSETGDEAHAQTFEAAQNPLVDTGVLPMFEATYEIYAYADGTVENPNPARHEGTNSLPKGTAMLKAPATASARMNGTDVTVEWGAVPHANVYQVEYIDTTENPNPNPSDPWTLLDVVEDVTSLTLTGGEPLEEGRAYRFRVFAGIDIDGMASIGELYTATAELLYEQTSGSTAPVLTGVTLVGDDADVRIDWEAPSASVSGYRVARKAGDGEWEVLTGDEITALTYTDTDVPAGVALTYRVYSVLESGENGDYGEMALTGMRPVDKVENVVGVSNTAGRNGVTLSWDSVSGASKYNIYLVTTAPDAEATLLTSTTDTTVQIDPDTSPAAALAYGSYYRFAVRAVVTNSQGDAVESTDYDAVGPYGMQVAPENLVATADADGESIRLSWTISAAPTQAYTIERAEGATGSFETIGDAPAGATEYIDAGNLTVGTRYYYKVKANPDEFGKYSATAYAAVGTADDLDTPANFSADVVSGSHDSISLTWDAVSGADGYIIRRNDQVTNSEAIIKEVTTTSYTDTGLTPALRFYYTVTAYVENGGVKEESEAASDNAFITPSSPDPLKAETDSEKAGITLSWTAVPGATGYAINAHTAQTVPSSQEYTIKTVTGTTATIEATEENELEYGKTYYFVIYPLFTFASRTFRNTSFFSETASGTLQIGVTGLEAKATSGTSVTLTWEWLSSTLPTEGFRIARATSETGTYVQAGVVDNTKKTFSDTGLIPGTEYFYKVGPLPASSGGESSVVSVTTETGTTPTPAPTAATTMPTNVTATATAIDTLKLTWTAATGATSYSVERTTSASGQFASVGTTTSLEYADAGLTINTAYYYRIVPMFDDVVGTASDVVTSGIPFSLYGLITAERESSSKIRLEWPRINFATHIAIERATSEDGTYERIQTIDSAHLKAVVSSTASPTARPTVTPWPTYYPYPTYYPTANPYPTAIPAVEYTDEKLSSGKTYYYRVVPIYSSGTTTIEGIAGTISGRTGGGGGGSTDSATGLTAKRSGFNTVALTWNAFSNASGVVISRSIGSGEFTEIADLPSGTLTYSDTDALPTPDQVKYRITPYTTSGSNRSLGTASGVVTITSELGAVGGLKAADDSSGLGTVLSWTATSGATEYHIYVRGTDSSPWQLQGVTFGPQNTSFLSEGQSVSGNYRYYVEAVARPSLSSNAAYSAAAQRSASITRRPQGDYMFAYLSSANQAAVATLAAADVSGQAAIGMTYASDGTFTLAGASGSSGSTVAIWPLTEADIAETDMRYSNASAIVP